MARWNGRMASKRLLRTSVMVDPIIHSRLMRLLERISFSAWIRRKERQAVEEAEREQPKPA